MTQPVKLTIRLTPGKDDDLIVWSASMSMHYGEKGEAIKQVLRRGMGTGVPQGSDPSLDPRALLADIRLVVEEAVQAGLSQYPVSLVTPSGMAVSRVNDEDQKQIETALSLLDQALLVELESVSRP